MTTTALLSIALIHLVAAMSPGPSFVVAIRTVVSDGFATAVALAIGFGLGAMRALLLAIIFANETLWYILVARVISTQRARQTYSRFKSRIDRVFGGLIAFFGARIALF